MRRRRCAVLAGLLLGVLAASPANAQGGKEPDPNSPAGVEYQLPLERARHDTGGGGNGGGADQAGDRGGSDSKLFGAGIGPRDGAGGSAGGGGSSPTGGSATKGGRGSGGGVAEGASRGTGEPSRSGTRLASAAGDGSPTLTIAGIALAVLLLGAGAGVGLRRLLRSGP